MRYSTRPGSASATVGSARMFAGPVSRNWPRDWSASRRRLNCQQQLGRTLDLVDRHRPHDVGDEAGRIRSRRACRGLIVEADEARGVLRLDDVGDERALADLSRAESAPARVSLDVSTRSRPMCRGNRLRATCRVVARPADRFRISSGPFVICRAGGSGTGQRLRSRRPSLSHRLGRR